MDWSSRQAGLVDTNGDGIPDTPFDGTTRLRDMHTSDTVALPRVTLEYQPDEHHFGWLTLARGYKASGFNTYATSATGAGQPYHPEYGNHVEIGYRLRGDDAAWELAATVFNTRLHDQQVVVIDSNGQSITTNAGRSHSRGAELSGIWRPLRQLELNAFVGYVNAEYDNYVTGGVSYAGKQFASTPRHSYGLSASWQPTAQWDLGVSWTRQGSANLYPNSAVLNQAYSLLDAHATWRVRNWSFGVYGKNLGNAHYYTRALSNDYLVAGNPRTVGVRVGVDF
jgi:outer membrane receptor protein involved in Fe transport